MYSLSAKQTAYGGLFADALAPTVYERAVEIISQQPCNLIRSMLYVYHLKAFYWHLLATV